MLLILSMNLQAQNGVETKGYEVQSPLFTYGITTALNSSTTGVDIQSPFIGYGITTSLNTSSSGLGIVITLGGNYALITTINKSYNPKLEEITLGFEEALQINLRRDTDFMSYAIIRYGYQHTNSEMGLTWVLMRGTLRRLV